MAEHSGWQWKSEDNTAMINRLLKYPVLMRALLRYPCVEYPYRALTKVLLPLESRELASTEPLRFPPVFIISTPRSGSTLLYQLLVHRFHFAYLPNIATLLNTTPIFATKLGLKYCKPYVSDFSSSYGLSRGGMAPAEAGRVWERWFPSPPIECLDEKPKSTVYQTVAAIEKLYGAPFISKYLMHSMYIQPLFELFPSALFIQIRRNPSDVAASILKARKKSCENIRDWWSAKPREFPQLESRDHIEQICGQVFYIEQNIEEGFTSAGEDRRHVVHYDALCANPNKELNEIAAFICSHAGIVKPKFDIPESFKASTYERKKNNHEERAMCEILAQYYNTTSNRSDTVWQELKLAQS